jgi:hypothetical protein
MRTLSDNSMCNKQNEGEQMKESKMHPNHLIQIMLEDDLSLEKFQVRLKMKNKRLNQ